MLLVRVLCEGLTSGQHWSAFGRALMLNQCEWACQVVPLEKDPPELGPGAERHVLPWQSLLQMNEKGMVSWSVARSWSNEGDEL